MRGWGRQSEFEEYKRTSEQMLEEKDAEMSKILTAKAGLQDHVSSLKAKLVPPSTSLSFSPPLPNSLFRPP